MFDFLIKSRNAFYIKNIPIFAIALPNLMYKMLPRYLVFKQCLMSNCQSENNHISRTQDCQDCLWGNGKRKAIIGPSTQQNFEQLNL